LSPRALRLPLSTGASSLRALSVPVGIFQIIAFGPLFIPCPDWIVLPLGILWAVWIFAIFGSIIEGVARRASDIVLEKQGLEIRGGPSRGLRLRWEEIDPERCLIDAENHLVLNDRIVATTDDPWERRSFEAVIDTVRAMGPGAPPAAHPTRADVLSCERCGTPALLADAAEVRCRACDAMVRVSDDQRAKIQNLRSLEGSRARSEKLLAVLLRQRGATFVNALVFLATPPLILGGPLAAIVFNEMFVTRHVFGFAHGVALFVCGLTFTYALSLLVQAEVVGRAALRLVALSFGARPPAVKGDPPGCRTCGALLSTSGDHAVVLCAYCRAENITDIDLRPQASLASEETAGLESTLEERLRTRRRYRWLSLLAVALLAVGAVTFERTFFGRCANAVRDGDETDVDCGGTCTRCASSFLCGDPADCRSGICTGGRCAAPRCDDGVRNGLESDVDCGGGECKRCARGQRADSWAPNCESEHVTLEGVCE